MSVKIIYSLSDAGRKASILSGGTADATREIVLAMDSPEYAAIGALGAIQGADVVWDVRYAMDGWDGVPSAADILARHKSAQEEKSRQDEERRAARTAQTRAVLSARKTTSRRESVRAGDGQADYLFLAPDWPYYSDDDVRASAEALAWEAEIAAANAAARAAAQLAAEAERDARTAAKELAAARKAARRAALGLREGDDDWRIEHGALAQCPAWDSGRRSKNWMAIISVSPSSPGGFARDFVPAARGAYYYLLPADLAPGDPVEFGADSYSSRGNVTRERWHGYVVRVIAESADQPGALILHECAGGRSACKEGAAFRAALGAEKPAQDAAAS